MNKKFLAVLALVVVALVTGISFAQTSEITVTSVDIAGPGGAFCEVAAVQVDESLSPTPDATPGGAEVPGGLITGVDLKNAGKLPDWDPSVDAAGSINPGDIYYIDATGYSGDVLVTLYLNNVPDLVKNYTYLNMQVNAYSLTRGPYTWAAVASVGTQYLTLTNGYVAFIVPSGEYDITIDGGTFYCIGDGDEGSMSPAFYIDVRQA